MREHLARIHMKDGEIIDIHRENEDVLIESKDHQVIVPQATGQQTLDWISLFEGLAEKVEYPEGAE